MSAAKSPTPKQPRPRSKVIMIFSGIGALLVGAVLLWMGIAPVFEVVGPAFSGGAPPPDMGEKLDAAIGGAAVPAGIGFVLLMGGFIALKMGMAPPKPKSVEEQVREEVERRLAASAAGTAPPGWNGVSHGAPDQGAPMNLVVGQAPQAVQPMGTARPVLTPARPAPAATSGGSPAASPPSATPQASQGAQGSGPAAATLQPAKCARCARPLLANGMCRVCDRAA